MRLSRHGRVLVRHLGKCRHQHLLRAGQFRHGSAAYLNLFRRMSNGSVQPAARARPTTGLAASRTNMTSARWSTSRLAHSLSQVLPVKRHPESLLLVNSEHTPTRCVVLCVLCDQQASSCAEHKRSPAPSHPEFRAFTHIGPPCTQIGTSASGLNTAQAIVVSSHVSLENVSPLQCLPAAHGCPVRGVMFVQLGRVNGVRVLATGDNRESPTLATVCVQPPRRKFRFLTVLQELDGR